MKEDPRLKTGLRVKLKKGLFPHVKVREWEIEEVEKKNIILRDRKKNYTLEVRPEDIEIDST